MNVFSLPLVMFTTPVEMNQLQIDTLVAIVDYGTFEAAARQLHTHERGKPADPRARTVRRAIARHPRDAVLVLHASTPEVLVRAGRQSYGTARLGCCSSVDASTELPVVVNADSLATWFRDVLDEAAGWDRVALRLHIEDQAHSHELLRSGDALAGDQRTGAGARMHRRTVGSLRYAAAASPAFAARWRQRNRPAWRSMPMVIFNGKDTLQHDMLRLHGVSEPPPIVHRVPASADFQEALRRGLGWGTMPEPQLRADIAEGRLVRLASRHTLDVALYWQHWRLQSALLVALTDAVRRAARAHLRP